jgi:predicted  nucleic acid-binding Zn-ribbon protein
MYDTMPADRHQIFAGMSEEELKQKLPPQTVNEYIRHGKEAGPDDEALRQAGFDEAEKRLPPDQLAQAAKRLYQRRLRDYAIEFDELAQRKLELLVDIDGIRKDNERLAEALASAKKLQAYREDEARRLNTDLAGITKERQAVEQHLAQLRRRIDRGRKLLEETLRNNAARARQLTALPSPPSGAATPALTPGLVAASRIN